MAYQIWVSIKYTWKEKSYTIILLMFKIGCKRDKLQTHTRIIGAQSAITTPILFLAAKRTTNYKIFSEKMN